MNRQTTTIAILAAFVAGLTVMATAGEPLPTNRVPSASFPALSLSQSGTAITDHWSVSSGLQNNLLSQPPLLTGRYTLNGQTVLPYIGAGFGGGEPTDLNRTIMRAGQDERILRDSLGKTLVPNEFQLGVRIPF